VGIWGVIDCPLKCEVIEQCDDQNTLLIDDADDTGEELEKSYKSDNQPQYINMSTLRREFPCLGQEWFKHGRRPIHCGSMEKMIKGYGHQLYNVDPHLNDNTSRNHEDIHSGFTKTSRHSHDQIQSGSMWQYKLLHHHLSIKNDKW